MISDRDIHVLGVLHAEGAASPELAADAAGLDSAQVARTLRRLLARGYAARAGRVFSLTDRGRKVLAGRQRIIPGMATAPPDRPAAADAAPPVPSTPRLARRQRGKAGEMDAPVLELQEVIDVHVRLQGDVSVAAGGDDVCPFAWTRLMVWGLTVFCGLRASEVAKLTVGDLDPLAADPIVRVPNRIAKKRGGRRVPLTWNRRFLADLLGYLAWRFGEDWHRRRHELAALPLVCAHKSRNWTARGRCRQGTLAFPGAGDVVLGLVETRGRRLDRDTIRMHWIAATAAVLGKTAVDARGLTTHSGRHTFCSLALQAGRTLVQVKEAAGHRNIATTSRYLHALRDPSEIDCMAGFYAAAASPPPAAAAPGKRTRRPAAARPLPTP